jgi:hypothetical protein
VPNKVHFRISPLSVSVRADGLWTICAAVLIVALVLWWGLHQATVCVVRWPGFNRPISSRDYETWKY